MDGLLIDSEPLWRRAEQEIFATVGIQLTDAMCEETMGFRTDEVIGHWFERSPWTDPSPKTLEENLIRQVRELILSEGKPLPGVLHALDEVSSMGWQVGLASSSAPPLIEATLERLGLAPRFEVTCSAQDEERGKPDPAVYLTAARRLGVEPSHCVALEDSLPGVRSALSAGMKVVAVPAPEQRSLPGFEEAHRILDSLEDFQARQL